MLRPVVGHIILLCLWWMFTSTSASNSRSIPAYMVDLLEGGRKLYDKQSTPTQHLDLPTQVNLSMYIEGMSSFRAQTMDFQLDVYFQQFWKDARLAHNESMRVLVRDQDILLKMWHPDIYFANARTADFHKVTQPNFLIWIESDGSILYDTRISMVVMCMMDLAKWPLDSQHCRLRVLSYAYDTDQLIIEWTTPDPIARNPDISMSDMHIVSMQPGLCDGNYTTGVWSCVTAEFFVKREIMHHIMQSYVPTILIVVISWFSFWLDVEAVPARVSLAITTLLTLSTQANSARMALPEVSYMKAIDVWMGTCMLFVFGVMIEFTIVNYAQRQGSMNIAGEKSDDKANDYNFGQRARGLIGRAAHFPFKRRDSSNRKDDESGRVLLDPMNMQQHSPSPFGDHPSIASSMNNNNNSAFINDTDEEREKKAYALIRKAMQRRFGGGSDNPRVKCTTFINLPATTTTAAPACDSRSSSRSTPENGAYRQLSPITERADEKPAFLRRPPGERLANWSTQESSLLTPTPNSPAAALSRKSGWNRLRSATAGSLEPESPSGSGAVNSKRSSQGDKWVNLIKTIQTNRKANARNEAKKIDQRSRWAFPLSFVIFNICYWTYYLYIA